MDTIVSPDDEHDVLETCRVKNKNKNKYIVKNCTSRWSFTKNHNMMHGPQNLKFCIREVPSAMHGRVTSYPRIFVVISQYVQASDADIAGPTSINSKN
jgi:hypothetical protein